MSICTSLLCCWKRVFAMTSALSWQNSVSLCPALFCAPRLHVPVAPGISWFPTFASQRVYFTINYLLKSPQSLKDLLGYLVHGYIFGLNSCKRYHFGLLSLSPWSLFYVLSKRCCKQISHDFSWFIHLPQIASRDSWTIVMDDSSSEFWTVLLSLYLTVLL